MFAKSCFMLCFLSVIQLFHLQLFAQRNENDTLKIAENEIHQSVTEVVTAPTTSVYLELGGKGVYSVNVDFRKKENRAMSIGLQWFEILIPNVMFYHFGGSKHRFETGGGISTGIIRDEGFAGMMIHGVIGYRYQKKKGLLFRAGFTPAFTIPFLDTGRYMFLPLPGVSIGYSF